ncbi:hypothetical protein CF54_00285 [Streptomyces sp. Tu 6176]|nr:hypothetical protein CF54_00285 [Streptomyces sp. Tu 6176]
MGAGDRDHGVDHDADQCGGGERGEEAEGQAEAAEEFGEAADHGVDAAGTVADRLEAAAGRRQAAAAEEAEQLLGAVPGHQQAEGQPQEQQTPVGGP